MPVKIGNIVTIISQESSYNGKQGKVAEIKHDGDEDGPIGVRFHRNQIWHCVDSEAECIVRHQEAELRVDASWSVESRAEQIYPRRYHSVYQLRFDFSPENPCMQAGCAKKATKRCIVNIWGTVSELDLCAEHGVIDGMMGELLPPLKDKYVPATPVREATTA